MKFIYGMIVLAIIGLTCCNDKQTGNNNKSTPEIKTEFGKINDFLKMHEEPSQKFNVSTDKPSKIKGKQGTTIVINPADLIKDNGQPIGKNIEIELKELTDQEQLLRTNAQTTSDGQLLISGGAYFINMTSDGQQVKLKDAKTLSVEFPKIASEKMSLFYGQRDSLGQLNWLPAKQKFENKPVKEARVIIKHEPSSSGEINAILGYIEHESNRPLTEEEQKRLEEKKKYSTLSDKVYKAIELQQFGWINCDRFYDIPNKTNLQYTFREKDSIVSAHVYLVFKDINSVMQSCYFSYSNKEYNSGFQNIPVGSKIQLIAISIKNGKPYTYKSDLTIKANETIQLTLKETNEDQFDRLFQSN